MPRNRSRKQTERALEAQLEKEANAERRRNQGASKKQKAQRDRARAAARQAITDAGLVTVPDADDTSGYADVGQLADLVRGRMQSPPGPAAAEQYRHPTPSPQQPRRSTPDSARPASEDAESSEESEGADEPAASEESDESDGSDESDEVEHLVIGSSGRKAGKRAVSPVAFAAE